MKRAVLPTLSGLMLIAGGYLLAAGVHSWFSAREGQNQAAEEWEKVSPDPFPVSRTPPTKTLRKRGSPAPSSGALIGKLTIPRLDAQMFVVEGIDDADLRRGPGHLSWSADPGGRGNCVIAGHRDTHFRILKEIQSGDRIVLETKAEKFEYRVAGLTVVEPTNTTSLNPTVNPSLTLVTCYPFSFLGAAPKRFIVRADLVSQAQPLIVTAKSKPARRRIKQTRTQRPRAQALDRMRRTSGASKGWASKS